MPRTTVLVVVSLLILLRLHAAEPMYYSFSSASGGGVASLLADPASGNILEHRLIFSHPDAAKADKIVVSPDQHYAATALSGALDARNLLIINLVDGSHRFWDIEEEVDHILMVKQHLYVGSTAGILYRVDLKRAAIDHAWNFRKLLTPVGRRSEDFVYDAQANHLWVSFQKDNKKRTQLGSRLVGIDLATDKIFADLQLPRDRPELHYAPDVDGRESGPNPEVLRVSPSSNRLFVTLDLYGAVGIADLDAARQGRLHNWTVLSTAPDGSWGSAFPDRVGDVQLAGMDMLLVANASTLGGTALVDLGERRLVQILPTHGGLNTLEFLPSLGWGVSASAGKTKARGTSGLEKKSTPLPIWVRFAPDDTPHGLKASPVVLDSPVHWAMPVDRAASPLVYLNTGENAEEWLIIEVVSAEVKSRVNAHGRVGRSTRTR